MRGAPQALMLESLVILDHLVRRPGCAAGNAGTSAAGAPTSDDERVSPVAEPYASRLVGRPGGPRHRASHRS